MSVALDRFQARHGLTIGTTGTGGFWAIQMIENTTFSTFAAELAGLVNDRSNRLLVQWTVAMVIGGGVAAAVGIAIGRSW